MVKKQARIPTLLALFVLAFLSVSGYVVLNNPTILFGQAQQPAFTLENIQVSNVTDTSFVASWQTQTAVPAYISYTTNATVSKAFDVRDHDGVAKSYRLHYVEVTGLTPGSSIAWNIVVAGTAYPQEPIIMGPTLSAVSQILPIYGALETTQDSNGGTIIFVKLTDGALWSMFLPEPGSWVFPLAPVRTSNHITFYCLTNTCSDQAPIIIVTTNEFTTKTIQTTIGDARPLIIEQVTMPTRANTPTPAVKGISVKASPTPTKTVIKNYPITIVNPVNNAKLSFSQPLFRGTGNPQEDVSLTLKSAVTQVGKTTVRSDGSWLWTAPLPLTNGTYTVTITTKDTNKKAVTLTRSFIILKSGEQVLAGATSAATLTPTVQPTIPLIATPTLYPTTTPPIPTPTTTMPRTGGIAPSMLLIGGGATLLLLGLTIL